MFKRLLKPLVREPPSCDDTADGIARFRIPENSDILKPALPFAPTYQRSQSVERTEVRDGVKYAIVRRIDGHPDLHHYLWNEAGSEIPAVCCWIIQARAAFANPRTNVIFAVAEGTHDVRFRLSQAHAAAFPESQWHSTGDGAESCWIRSRLYVDEDRRLLALAYTDAETRYRTGDATLNRNFAQQPRSGDTA